MMNKQPAYVHDAQIKPGMRVLVLIKIGRESFWWNGRVLRWEGGLVKVQIEYEDMAMQRKSATITINPKQIRFPQEGKK